MLIQSDPLNAMDCINFILVVANLDHIVVDCRSLLGSFKFASVMFLSTCFIMDARHMANMAKVVGSKLLVGVLFWYCTSCFCCCQFGMMKLIFSKKYKSNNI